MQNRRQFLKGISFSALGVACTTGALTSSISFPSIAKASLSQKEPDIFSETQLLMGTYVTLKAVHTSQDLVYQAFEETFLEMKKAEDILSRHNGASALSILNTQKYLQDAPLDLFNVAQEAQKIQNWSKGAFNISVLPVLEYLEYSDLHNLKISQEKIRALYQAVATDALSLNNTTQIFTGATSGISSSGILKTSMRLKNADTKITLDGIAKGYIVDKAIAILAKHGLQDCLVNAGGDVRALGMKNASLMAPCPWRVAIEDPEKQAKYPAIVPLYNCALATSGTYEKLFGSQNHLIMPHFDTKNISSKILSVSVKAQNTMLADAIATALSCLPVQEAISICDSIPHTSCFIITEDKKQYQSKNWLIS